MIEKDHIFRAAALIYSVTLLSGLAYSQSTDRKPIQIDRTSSPALQCPREMLPLNGNTAIQCVNPEAMLRIKEGHNKFEAEIARLAEGQLDVEFETKYLAPQEHRLADQPFNLPVLRVVFQTDRFFDSDESEILPEAVPAWRIISDALVNAPDGSALFVVGHTDSDGGNTYNLNLGSERAKAVARAIVTRGAYDTNLYTLTFGEEMPLTSNATSDGKAQNRRVEFLFSIRIEVAEREVGNDKEAACARDPFPEKCKVRLDRPKTPVTLPREYQQQADVLNDEEASVFADEGLSEAEKAKKLKDLDKLRGRIPVSYTERKKVVRLNRRNKVN